MNKATSKKVPMSSDTVTSKAIRGNQKKVPTLEEMISACDLTVERHQDAVAFEIAPATGVESL